MFFIYLFIILLILYYLIYFVIFHSSSSQRKITKTEMCVFSPNWNETSPTKEKNKQSKHCRSIGNEKSLTLATSDHSSVSGTKVSRGQQAKKCYTSKRLNKARVVINARAKHYGALRIKHTKFRYTPVEPKPICLHNRRQTSHSRKCWTAVFDSR